MLFSNIPPTQTDMYCNHGVSVGGRNENQAGREREREKERERDRERGGEERERKSNLLIMMIACMYEINKVPNPLH